MILACAPVVLRAQGSNLPMDPEVYQLLDRLEIASGTPAPYHSSLKYYTRGDVIRYALTLDSAQVQWRKGAKEQLLFLFKDNNEWLGAPEFSKELGNFRKNGGDPPLSQIEMSQAHPQFLLEMRRAAAEMRIDRGAHARAIAERCPFGPFNWS